MTEYIHHDPDRTCYSVTEDELNNITEKAQPLWKDVCLISFSIGISTLLNAIDRTISQETFTLDIVIFLNYLFALLGIILGVIFGIAWYQTHISAKNLINRIKSKPKMELNASTSNVGALEKEIKELNKKSSTSR